MFIIRRRICKLSIHRNTQMNICLTRIIEMIKRKFWKRTVDISYCLKDKEYIIKEKVKKDF